MDLIQMTRDLGKALQASDEYRHYEEAKIANDNDAELQKEIEEFNLVRIKLSNAMQQEEQDAEAIAALDHELKEVYTKVMGNQHMLDFNIAKNDLDALMNKISGILMMCVNGEDPETCEPPTSCGGDCGSCGGCH